MKADPASPLSLANLRAGIDAIDDKLLALLNERIRLVKSVGALKDKTHPGQCPIRPGREAEMVRRIAGLCASSDFPAAAAAAIWRLLIGASTSVESPLSVSAYVSQDESLYWLAREYFGGFVPVHKQPTPESVIADVAGGKASVGMVPVPNSQDTWWTKLMDANAPKIFARVPFVAQQGPEAFAIASIAPEPSGNDRSLFAIENGKRLTEVEGFTDALPGGTFLGAYAVPLVLS